MNLIDMQKIGPNKGPNQAYLVYHFDVNRHYFQGNISLISLEGFWQSPVRNGRLDIAIDTRIIGGNE